jgi:hypothetical protein
MADIYNKNDPPPPKTVQFLEAFLLKCLDIQGQPVVGVEECVLLLLLLLPSPIPFIHFQIRAWRIQKVQQQLGMGRRQTVRPLPFTRLPLSQSSSSIVRPRVIPACRSNTPQAFSHWTLTYSRGKLLICDIQACFPPRILSCIHFLFCLAATCSSQLDDL